MKSITIISLITKLLLLSKTQLTTSKNSILVVGSLNSDSYIPITRFPKLGENIQINIPNIDQIPGGKGCNQAISISRLSNKKVSFVGRFGNDIQGKNLYKTLKKENVDLKLCKFTNCMSGQGIVFQNEHGQVSAIVLGGSNIHGWENDDAEFRTQVSNYIKNKCIRTILLQREIPDEVNELVACVGKENGCVIIQDLGGQDLPLSREYIGTCDYLIPNETELKRLLATFVPEYDNDDDGIDSIIESAKLLQKETNVKNLVVTLGSRGCIYLNNNEVEYIPACKLPKGIYVVDETGAGDAFRGAFALALTENLDKMEDERGVIRQALVFASAAGALAVTKQGAVPSLPMRNELEWLLSQQDGLQEEYSTVNADNQAILEEETKSQPDKEEQPSLLQTRGGGDAPNGNDFPFLIGSRLNSMKDRLDLWPDKSKNVENYIKRQSTIRGLTCIDFNYPQHFTDLTPKQAKAQLDKYNLKAGAVCLRYPHELYQQGSFTHYDESIRKKAIELTKEAADAARILGCNEVVIWSAYDGYDYSFQVQYEDKFQQIVTAFQELCDDYPDIKFSLEYKPTDENTRFFVIPSTGTALYLVQQINRENMGLTLDFGHCLMAGENPAQSVSLVASQKKLFGIQLNDGYSRLAAEDGLIFGSIHPYFALEVMYYLLKHEYDGHVYFDTFPQRSDPVVEAEKNIWNVKMFWKAAKRLRDVLDIEKDMMVHNAIAVMKKMDDALDWARNN